MMAIYDNMSGKEPRQATAVKTTSVAKNGSRSLHGRFTSPWQLLVNREERAEVQMMEEEIEVAFRRPCNERIRSAWLKKLEQNGKKLQAEAAAGSAISMQRAMEMYRAAKGDQNSPRPSIDEVTEAVNFVDRFLNAIASLNPCSRSARKKEKKRKRRERRAKMAEIAQKLIDELGKDGGDETEMVTEAEHVIDSGVLCREADPTLADVVPEPDITAADNDDEAAATEKNSNTSVKVEDADPDKERDVIPRRPYENEHGVTVYGNGPGQNPDPGPEIQFFPPNRDPNRKKISFMPPVNEPVIPAGAKLKTPAPMSTKPKIDVSLLTPDQKQLYDFLGYVPKQYMTPNLDSAGNSSHGKGCVRLKPLEPTLVPNADNSLQLSASIESIDDDIEKAFLPPEFKEKKAKFIPYKGPVTVLGQVVHDGWAEVRMDGGEEEIRKLKSALKKPKQFEEANTVSGLSAKKERYVSFEIDLVTGDDYLSAKCDVPENLKDMLEAKSGRQSRSEVTREEIDEKIDRATQNKKKKEKDMIKSKKDHYRKKEVDVAVLQRLEVIRLDEMKKNIAKKQEAAAANRENMTKTMFCNKKDEMITEARARSSLGHRQEVEAKANDHKSKMDAQERNLDEIKRERDEKIEVMKRRRQEAKFRADTIKKHTRLAGEGNPTPPSMVIPKINPDSNPNACNSTRGVGYKSSSSSNGGVKIKPASSSQ